MLDYVSSRALSPFKIASSFLIAAVTTFSVKNSFTSLASVINIQVSHLQTRKLLLKSGILQPMSPTSPFCHQQVMQTESGCVWMENAWAKLSILLVFVWRCWPWLNKPRHVQVNWAALTFVKMFVTSQGWALRVRCFHEHFPRPCSQQFLPFSVQNFCLCAQITDVPLSSGYVNETLKWGSSKTGQLKWPLC